MRPLFICAVLLTVLAPSVFAQGACKTPSADCVVVGEWNFSVGLGFGERSNPVAGNSDIPLVVVPQLSYYGKRFFIENLELGFTLYEGAEHTFNLIATPGYDRVFFIRDDLQNYFVPATVSFAEGPVTVGDALNEFEIAPRRTTYLVGGEWLFSVGKVAGQLDALYEATGRHKGYEVRAALAAPLALLQDSLTISAGLTWKSAELVGYYYGIEGYYDPGAALNPFVKLGYSRELTERWMFNAFVHYEYLGGSIADSPIIDDDAVTTVFAGVIFKIF